MLDALASRSDFRSRIVDVVVDVGRPELQPQVRRVVQLMTTEFCTCALIDACARAILSWHNDEPRTYKAAVRTTNPLPLAQNLAKYDIRLYLRPAVVTRRVARLVKAMLATAHFEVVDLPGYPRSTPAPDVDALRCGPHYLDRAAPATLADLLHPPRWAPFTEDA